MNKGSASIWRASLIFFLKESLRSNNMILPALVSTWVLYEATDLISLMAKNVLIGPN